MSKIDRYVSKVLFFFFLKECFKTDGLNKHILHTFHIQNWRNKPRGFIIQDLESILWSNFSSK